MSYLVSCLEGEAAVKVRYFKDKITVHTLMEVGAVQTGDEDWKLCFESDGVILPLNYYFGLSAVTGDLSDNHDIHAFKVCNVSSKQDACLKCQL